MVFLFLFLLPVQSMSQVTEGSKVQSSKAQRGLITSGACPLSCADLGVPQKSCRSWTQYGRCFVEDTRLPPGHRSLAFTLPPGESTATRPSKNPSMRRGIDGTWISVPPAQDDAKHASRKSANKRGLVTSARCPYDCQRAGLSGNTCRAWKEGNTCYVEDLEQSPGHRSLIELP